MPGTDWHHVAVSYTFGESDSIRGYVDGEEVKGAWDMGGATAARRWWTMTRCGSARRWAAHRRLESPGRLDELAIYRTALTHERIRIHAAAKPSSPGAPRPW